MQAGRQAVPGCGRRTCAATSGADARWAMAEAACRPTASRISGPIATRRRATTLDSCAGRGGEAGRGISGHPGRTGKPLWRPGPQPAAAAELPSASSGRIAAFPTVQTSSGSGRHHRHHHHHHHHHHHQHLHHQHHQHRPPLWRPCTRRCGAQPWETWAPPPARPLQRPGWRRGPCRRASPRTRRCRPGWLRGGSRGGGRGGGPGREPG
jgi:hypothetical protein